MKTKPEQPIKLRNKFSPSEIFYTFSGWSTKEIDGVTFLSVVKSYPSPEQTQLVHLIRKDSLERVK